jgi:RHS repeat-associated protein
LVEKVTLGAVTSWKHYVAGGSGPVAVYTRKSSGTNEVHYLTTDHLGSIDSIVDSNGVPEVRLSYGAFGARRNEATWSGNPPPADWTEITDDTRRGFTAHEMLDNLSLIHMNGRVYDQAIGRFLSADPFVPAPDFTQSFNRYSYVYNNPLSYTDPTGFVPSPDDPTPCGEACYVPPGFFPGPSRPRGPPVPNIPLRGGAKIVPVSGIECDMGVCGSAQ